MRSDKLVMKCWIYAFFDGKTILYVGQACDLRNRESIHRHTKPECACAEFRVIRKCDTSEASRIERQIILACRRKGQAKLNKTLPRIGAEHQARDLGAIACGLGVSLPTLKNYLRGGYYDHKRGKFVRTATPRRIRKLKEQLQWT